MKTRRGSGGATGSRPGWGADRVRSPRLSVRRSRRVPQGATRRPRDLENWRPRHGLASPTGPPRPLLALPRGLRWASLPPPTHPEPGSVTSPPPQRLREKQSYPSRGPQLHTKPPEGPRRLHASLIPLRELREQRPALPRLPPPPPGKLRWGGATSRRWDLAHVSTPPQAGPSARRTLSHLNWTGAATCGRRRAGGEYSHWVGPRRDLVGKDARVGERNPNRLWPCRLLRREASTVRPRTCSCRARTHARAPLPAPPRPAGPAPPRPAPPASSFPAGSHRSAPRAGAIGAFPETYAKRHGKPSTKMSCDILLMAIIYSKSSLDWNDQLAARNALWSKLSHSLLQDGYHIFIRCVFCNQNQQGVERSVINALLQKERERSSSIVWRRRKSYDSYYHSHLLPTVVFPLGIWEVQWGESPAPTLQATRVTPGTGSLWTTESTKRSFSLLYKYRSGIRITHSLFLL